MDKKKLGVVSFLAGLTIGAATALLNQQNRKIVKEKAVVIKESTSELGGKVKGKVKDTVNTIGSTIEMKSKDILKSQSKESQEEIALNEDLIKETASSEASEEFIPEQLDVASEPGKEEELGNDEVEVEEAEELLEGNGDILIK